MEARAGAAPNRPVPGSPAHPDKAVAYGTVLFTPRKQKAEVFEAGVFHNAMQAETFVAPAGRAAAKRARRRSARISATHDGSCQKTEVKKGSRK